MMNKSYMDEENSDQLILAVASIFLDSWSVFSLDVISNFYQISFSNFVYFLAWNRKTRKNKMQR